MRRITFGKEYELSANLELTETRAKVNDGSGPSEIRTPPFRSVLSAVVFEYVLKCFYGDSLFMYYRRGNGCEEKGNHFHFRFVNVDGSSLDYGFLYEFYYVSAPLFLLVRKLLTIDMRFRNSVGKWCKYFVNYVYSPGDLKVRSGREYAFVTFNRNNKRVLTFEVRASEGSVVTDLCALGVVLGLFLVLRNEVRVDVGKWKGYCLWVDKFKVVVDEFCNECTCDEDEDEFPRIHVYLMYDAPVELSIPVPTEDGYDVVSDLETVVPLERVMLRDKLRKAVVRDNSFRYIVPVARKGLERYGQEFENVAEFIELLDVFEREYVFTDRTRREFVNIMYRNVRERVRDRFNRFVFRVAKWLVEE